MCINCEPGTNETPEDLEEEMEEYGESDEGECAAGIHCEHWH